MAERRRGGGQAEEDKAFGDDKSGEELSRMGGRQEEARRKDPNGVGGIGGRGDRASAARRAMTARSAVLSV